MPIEIKLAGTYDTVREVAQKRGVEPRTVQYWIDKGWLPAIAIPSATGTRPVVSIINRADWHGFIPPPPGVRAQLEEEMEPVMDIRDEAITTGDGCPNCGAATTYYIAGVEFCKNPDCGWREVAV